MSDRAKPSPPDAPDWRRDGAPEPPYRLPTPPPPPPKPEK